MDLTSQCRSLKDVSIVLIVLVLSIDGYPDHPGPDVKDFEIFQRSVTVHDFVELSYEHYFGVMTIYRGK